MSYDDIKLKAHSSHSTKSAELFNNKKTEKDYTIGNYLIKKTLGQGTFGKVRLGVHLPDNSKVAVKILEKERIVEKDDEIRVRREFEMLIQFNHINVILVSEIFENRDSYYCVMEFCDGGELFNYIVKKQRLSEEESAFFFYQLINGLEYIHSLGIVHRDLKPENLLLTKNHILKIIDFGLSNFFSKNQSELLSTPCGSPCYASPEMVSGKKYDGFKIDVWSTGIILYAMLCGYLPFEDKDNEKLFKQILECKLEFPPHLSTLSMDLVKKILVTDPEKRITIEGIKKHQFFLKGKALFEMEFSYFQPQLEENYNLNTEEDMQIIYKPLQTEVNEKYNKIGYDFYETVPDEPKTKPREVVSGKNKSVSRGKKNKGINSKPKHPLKSNNNNFILREKNKKKVHNLTKSINDKIIKNINAKINKLQYNIQYKLGNKQSNYTKANKHSKEKEIKKDKAPHTNSNTSKLINVQKLKQKIKTTTKNHKSMNIEGYIKTEPNQNVAKPTKNKTLTVLNLKKKDEINNQKQIITNNGNSDNVNYKKKNVSYNRNRTDFKSNIPHINNIPKLNYNFGNLTHLSNLSNFNSLRNPLNNTSNIISNLNNITNLTSNAKNRLQTKTNLSTSKKKAGITIENTFINLNVIDPKLFMRLRNKKLFARVGGDGIGGESRGNRGYKRARGVNQLNTPNSLSANITSNITTKKSSLTAANTNISSFMNSYAAKHLHLKSYNIPNIAINLSKNKKNDGGKGAQTAQNLNSGKTTEKYEGNYCGNNGNSGKNYWENAVKTQENCAEGEGNGGGNRLNTEIAASTNKTFTTVTSSKPSTGTRTKHTKYNSLKTNNLNDKNQKKVFKDKKNKLSSMNRLMNHLNYNDFNKYLETSENIGNFKNFCFKNEKSQNMSYNNRSIRENVKGLREPNIITIDKSGYLSFMKQPKKNI